MKLWIRNPRTDLAYAGLLLAAMLLATCSDARAHFRFGEGTGYLSIQSFDRETGELIGFDKLHGLRWEMTCRLERAERDALIAGSGILAPMRFQKNRHTAELRLGRLRPGKDAELDWVAFEPRKLVLL
jgi:hypothetical protein